jgi:hypothetical protein
MIWKYRLSYCIKIRIAEISHSFIYNNLSCGIILN